MRPAPAGLPQLSMLATMRRAQSNLPPLGWIVAENSGRTTTQHTAPAGPDHRVVDGGHSNQVFLQDNGDAPVAW